MALGIPKAIYILGGSSFRKLLFLQLNTSFYKGKIIKLNLPGQVFAKHPLLS